MDASGPPRTALPGFVSTAVLTSSDGLFGDNVEEQRISEAPAPNAQDAADYKPLYERLQELKDKKDSEWKQKNNPFAPPKALDDEEIQFIRDLEERQTESQQRRKEQHNEDLAEFLLAKQKNSGSAHATNGTGGASAAGSLAGAVLTEEALQKYVKPKKKEAPVVVRAKRKAAPKDKSVAGAKKQKAAIVAATEEKEKAKSVGATPSIGLVAYGSDSDDSD